MQFFVQHRPNASSRTTALGLFGRAIGLVGLFLGVLGMGSAAAQQPTALGDSPASIPYYFQHPDAELPAALTDRLPDRVEAQIEKQRARLRDDAERGVSATQTRAPSKSHRPRVQPSQSWALTDNPNPALNFDFTGTPQYAGDVNGDDINDYIYTDNARDERSSQLEDKTAKTALFFGGTPPQTEDQLVYEHLIPVGDLNDDGFDDALARRPEQGTYRVYTGSMSGYQESGTALSAPDISGEAKAAVQSFADLDGDGVEDLLVGEPGGAMYVAFGNASLGDISFQSYTSGSFLATGRPEMADHDGDGQGAIVRFVSTQDTSLAVQVLEFGSERTLAETQRSVIGSGGQPPSRLRLLDITGNGRQEIVLPPQEEGGSTIVIGADSSGTYGSPFARFRKRNLVPVGDLDGDGNHDFHFTDDTGTRYVAYGPDTLSTGLSFDTEIPFAADVSSSIRASSYGGFGDVTGDGRADVVLGYENDAADQMGRRFFSVTEDRTARSPTDVTYPEGQFFDRITETEEIDFDDDGVMDVAMARSQKEQVEIFYGGSSLSQSPDLTLSISDTTNIQWVSSGDLNGDDTPDLIAGGHNQIAVFYGGDSPDATADHTILAEDLSIDGLEFPEVIGDVNNDGNDDLLVRNSQESGTEEQSVVLFYGGSPPSSIPDVTIPYSNGVEAGQVAAELGDVNGDGIDDFAVGRPAYEEGQVDVYFGADNDNPSFQTADLTLNASRTQNRYGYGLTAGDFNGDGVNDIATKPSLDSDPIRVQIFHGGTSIDATADRTLDVPADVFGRSTDDNKLSSQWGPLEGMPDIDGDGADELVLASGFSSTNAALYRPNQSSSPALTFEAPNQEISLGGFNNNMAVRSDASSGTADLVLTQQYDNNDAASSSRVYRYDVAGAVPPSSPSGLEARVDPQQDEIQLEWDSVDVGNGGGYNLYRSRRFISDPTDGMRLNSSPLSDTSYVDTDVQVGEAYYYRVTAVNAGGNESNPTEQVTAGIPQSEVGLQRAAANLSGVTESASAVADVNRDGYPDLLIMGEDAAGEANTTLYLGGEDGYTPANAALADLKDGSISIADVNGDENPDLFLTGRTSTRVEQTAYYLGNGDGTFEQRDAGPNTSFLNVAEGSSSLGDVNGDGHLDLVLTGEEQRAIDNPETTVVYFGNGQGDFTRGTGLTGVTDGSTSIADVDGNGAEDILITGETSDGTATSILYLGDPADSTFTEANANLEGVRFSSSAIADVNDDDNLDILITGEGSDSQPTTSLYLGDGQGGFPETTTDLPEVEESSIALAEVDADDTPDLLMTGDADATDAGESTLSARFYTGDGDGTFSRANVGMTGVEVGSATIEDADGDGDHDLLVTGSDALYGAPSARLYVNRSLQRGMNRTPRFARTFSGGRALLAGQSRTHLVEAGDPDGDSITVRSPTPDVTVADSGDGGTSVTFAPGPSRAGQTVNVRVEARDARGATGAFTASFEVPSLVLQSVDAELTDISRGESLFGDVNGDGHQDLLLTGQKFVRVSPDSSTSEDFTTLYLGDGQGGFSTADADLSAELSGPTAIADLNGDDRPDLLFGSDLYLQQSDGTFEQKDPGLGDITVGSISIANVNGDEHQDLLVTGSDANGDELAALYVGNGDGTFDPSGFSLEDISGGSTSIADLNGDGHLDLLITGGVLFGEKSTVLYLGNGDGTFDQANAGLEDLSDGDVSIADVNRDSTLDILLTGRTADDVNKTILYLGQGGTDFTKANAGLVGVDNSSTEIADFDGNGTQDLLVAGNDATFSRTTTLYLQDGDGSFSPAAGLPDLDDGGTAVGDIDADSDPDLLITGNSTEEQYNTILYENRTDRNPPQVAVSNTVTADGEVAFEGTGTNLNFSGVSGSGSVSVSRYSGPPSDTSGIDAQNVSDARVTIETSSGLSFDSTEVELAVSRFSGINDPTNVTVYKRDTPGEGTFAALETRVGDNDTPEDISDDTLYATTKSFSEFALGSDTEPLPVELASFDATVDDGTVALSWQTASEKNNAGFRIQRKAMTSDDVKPSRTTGMTSGPRDGSTSPSEGGSSSWTTIGNVEGAGTTSEAQSYRFTDAELPYEADALTYRLKQVDTDGSANYSETVTVERGVTQVELLGTYPNPARSRATIRYALPEKQDVTIRLYDVLGRRVRTVVSGPKEGRHKQTLDVGRLSSGVYFLRLQSGGEIRTQKLTVVR